MLMLSRREIQRLAYRFEGMAEHAVAYVMEECRGDGDASLMIAIAPIASSLNVALDNAHERTSSVKYTDTMSEAGMHRSWKDKLGKS